LKAKFDSPESRTIKAKRERIPEPVRIAVWRRDEGCCARCRSRERLEYDHIIPVDRGGSNTVRNVELLCERCNRAKSNNIE
jgi:5-methylcytosine-specific restriction endonuclease McrA